MDRMVLEINRLKQIMRRQGITQVELERITGIAQPDISRIILGKKEGLTLLNAARIAKALGHSIEYIWPHLLDWGQIYFLFLSINRVISPYYLSSTVTHRANIVALHLTLYTPCQTIICKGGFQHYGEKANLLGWCSALRKTFDDPEERKKHRDPYGAPPVLWNHLHQPPSWAHTRKAYAMEEAKEVVNE